MHAQRLAIYRPVAEHRRNVQGVLMPLTAAIHEVFGNRAQDEGRPIGAFYPRNVSSAAWDHLGGIWYRASDEQKVKARRVNASVVKSFAESILTGQEVVLPNGTVVGWERIPEAEAAGLPPPLLGA